MFSIIIHFFNNKDAATRQIENLAAFRRETLARFKLILVDDCSDPAEAIEPKIFLRPSLAPLDVKIYRVADQIVWNQTGARNLGCHVATTDWLFCTDVDHFIDEENTLKIDRLVSSGLDRDTIYRISRLEQGAATKPHANTFVVNRHAFQEVGGYDEDFAGGSGYSDKYFFHLWRRAKKSVSALDDVKISVDRGAKTRNISRDMTRNQQLYLQKKSGQIQENKKRLNFRWKLVFEREPATRYPQKAAMPATPGLSPQQSAPEAVVLRLRSDQQEALDTVLSHKDNFMVRTGWLTSIASKSPVDERGNPIPWVNYPTIKLLGQRLSPELDLFEYGCGHSTLWYQKRVRSVIALEHQAKWIKKIEPQVHKNVTLIHVPLDETDAYQTRILKEHRRFDIIVIDGRRRVACASEALKVIKPTGVIIWDNTNRDRYEDGIQLLKSAGFKQLELIGICPMVWWETATSIFYREGNCLGL